MSDFYSLTIDKISPLTPNAVAVSFAIPKELENKFVFEAGQYITIKHKINGEEVRRAYSISSSPEEKYITIGIKKVPEGVLLMSKDEFRRAFWQQWIQNITRYADDFDVEIPEDEPPREVEGLDELFPCYRHLHLFDENAISCVFRRKIFEL